MAGAVTVGSNYSDAVPKAAMQAVFDAFTKKTGIPVTVNTVEHNAYQEQINNYLQGKPDDVFAWFAGYRMQFFAAQRLVDAHRRRVDKDRRQLLRCHEAGLHRRGRAPVLHADLQLPVGRVLPQEPVHGEGLHSRRPRWTN